MNPSAQISRGDETLLSTVAAHARRAPDAPALLDSSGRQWSYGALISSAERLLAAARAAGIDGACRVALALHDGPAMALALLALPELAPCAPVAPGLGAAALAAALRRCGANVVLAEAGAGAALREAAAAAGADVLELELPKDEDLAQLALRGAVRSRPSAAPLSRVALLMPTSGTSGEPKQVPMGHAMCLAGAQIIARAIAVGPADRCLCLAPLLHVSGQFMALFAALVTGGSVVCVAQAAHPEVLRQHRGSGATWACAVPALLQRLAEETPDDAGALGLRFIHTGAAALTPTVHALIEAAFRCEVIQSYGMTETLMICCNPRGAGRRPGTVGPPQQELRLLDEGGEAVPAGELGEVAVRGPAVMGGYLDHPPLAAGAWFRTGDLGRLDEAGFLRITGRAREIINRGGEKVSPAEVDAVLEQHPAVFAACCFAAPHERLGEDVLAAVVLRPGAAADEGALRDFAARRLPPVAVPRRILPVAELPRNAAGKKQRAALAAQLAEAAREEDGAQRLDVSGLAKEAAERKLEAWLLGLLSQITGRGDASPTATFLELGIDSLGLAELRGKIERGLGRPLSASCLFTHPSCRQLAALLRERALPATSALALRLGPLERPLSPSELNWHAEAESGSGLIVLSLRVRGPLRRDVLAAALAALTRRHPLLQVHVAGTGFSRRFVAEGTEPVPLRERALPSSGIDALLGELLVNQPQQGRAPLMDVCLAALSDCPGEQLLILRLNHAIWDGGNRFADELLDACGRLLRGEALDLASLPCLKSSDDLVRETPVPRAGLGSHLACLGRMLRFDNIPLEAPPGPARTAFRRFLVAPAETAALKRVAAQGRMGVSALASAALLLSLRAEQAGDGARPLSLMTWIDVRSHYEPPLPPEHLGAHISIALSSLPIAREQPLLDVAGALRAHMAEELALGRALAMRPFYAWLFRLAIQAPWLLYKKGRVCTAVVSEIRSFEDGVADFGPLSLVDVQSVGSNHGLGACATLYLVWVRGALQLVLAYPAHRLAAPRADRILEETVRRLREVAAP